MQDTMGMTKRMAAGLMAATVALAQIGTPLDGTTPPALSQGAPVGTYALSGFETVNLFNGGLNFQLPLAQLQGRGKSEIPLTLAIERKWTVNVADSGGNYIRFPITDLDPRFAPVVRGYLNPGRLMMREEGRNVFANCTNGASGMYRETLTRVTFIRGDGTEMEFLDAKTGGALSLNSPIGSGDPVIYNCPAQASDDRGRVWVTRDGSFASLIFDSPVRDGASYNNGPPVPLGGGPNAYLFLKDGTRLKFTNQLLQEIRDANGNLTAFGYDGFNRMSWMRDSTGRLVSVTYDQQNTTNPAQYDRYDLIQYPGTSGVPRAIKVHYCFLDPGDADLAEAIRKPCPGYSATTAMTYGALFGMNGSTSTKFNPTVVSAVELPDGRRYGFRYNVFGELTRVDLPTGGALGYEWGPGPGTFGNGVTNVSVNAPMIYRRVNKRTVYGSGSIVEGQTEYVATQQTSGCAPEPYCTTVETRLEDAAGTVKQAERHYFYGSTANPDTYFDSNYYPSALEGREYRVEQMNVVGGAATTAAVVTATDWEQRVCLAAPAEICPTSLGVVRAGAIDLRTKRVTTTLVETGKSSAKETEVFDRYNNPVESTETGFEGLYRRTSRLYLTASTAGWSYTLLLATNLVENNQEPDILKTVHIRNLVADERVKDAAGAELAHTAYEYDLHSGAAPRHAARTASGAPNRDATVPDLRGNLTQVSRELKTLLPGIPSTKQLLTNNLFDDAGNVVGQVDPKGNQTGTQYSTTYGAAWPTQITNAAGHVFTIAYDAATGQVASFTDPNSKVTTYSRAGDLLDRLTSATLPDGGSVQFKYCDAGSTQACDAGMEPNSFRKRTKQDSCGTNTVINDGAYDGLGRPRKETQYEAGTSKIIRETQYDFAGRASKVSNPSRTGAGVAWTETQYDSLGRVVKTISPSGAETKFTPSGHLLTVEDAAGKKTQQVKDAFGRIASVVEDPGGVQTFTTNYRYSVLDDLVGVCQGAAFSGTACGSGGLGRSFEYDSVRRLAKAENPESGIIRYEYDDNGNVTKRTDANGVIAITVYDALNRATAKTYSDATTAVSYRWDMVFKGRMDRVANGVSTTDYTAFDALGRVTASSQTTAGQAPYQMTYAYNLAGGLAQEKYPSGKLVNSCYDEAGRVKTVKKQANATSVESPVGEVTQYAEHGAVATATVGPVTETTGFNVDLQMTGRSGVTAASTWQMTLEYCPQAASTCATNNGNVLGQTAMGNARWDYTYDRLNRLKTVQEKVGAAATWHQTYKFDPYGNRSIVNDAGTLIPYESSTPRVASESDPSPFTVKNQWNGAEFDLAGNQKTAWGNGTATGAAKYSYDAENRLKKAEVQWPSGTSSVLGTVEYGYDGDGRRVTKSVGGVVKTIYVYDAMGQLVAEYGESAEMPCSPCYLTQDHLGSTRAVWAANGSAVKVYDYAPFGEEVPAIYRSGDSKYPSLTYPRPGGQGVSLEYTGKERDAETGLDYFGARYMASAQGRFTSPDVPFADQDAADPQSWNLYSYVRNNPLIFVDPTGNDCVYTNNFTADGSVGLQAGTGDTFSQHCSRNGGVYVNGTVDANSITYDRRKNEIGYSYANAELETGGGGTIGLPKQLDQDELRLKGIFQDNRQLWNTTAFLGNSLAVGTGALMLAPAAAEVAMLPTMQVAVGKMVGSWHVAYQAGGGPWLHGMRFGGAGVEVVETAAAGFARGAWRIPFKILNDKAVTATAGTAAASCAHAACNAILRGLNLR